MKNEFSSETSTGNLSVKVGEAAPDFTLKNHFGEDWKLGNQRGKVLALLFYPQNETLVCTRQLCSIKKYWADYLKTKAEIVGISPNSVENHQKFSQKYELPIQILADESNEITKIFCKHWLFPVSFMRSVVIVDADGIVRFVKTMIRAVRPTDRLIIAAIYAARADEINKTYASLTERFRSILEYRI